jgi:hypothetical protein
MPRGDNGEMRFCPACKRGCFFTVVVVKGLTIATCRGGGGHPPCGNVSRIRYF